MALNLSRNTKVFVSSVNGVHASGGSVKTVDVIAGTNSGHAVGDVLTFATTNGSGTGFKCIVAAVNSGAVTEVYIPNNFRGAGYADNNTVTSTASTGSGADGLVLTINGVTSTNYFGPLSIRPAIPLFSLGANTALIGDGNRCIQNSIRGRFKR